MTSQPHAAIQDLVDLSDHPVRLGPKNAVTPKFDMPRDMSGFSTLEAKMLGAIHAVGLLEPVAEYQFDRGCCGHTKRRHRYGECEDCAVPWLNESVSGTVNGNPVTTNLSIRYYGPRSSHDYIPARRWRFDFAWPDRMVAVECEGGTYTGGRHTTGVGFEKDAEKYDEAALRGWTVLRFTQRQITSGVAIELVERALTVTEVQ